MTFDFKFELYQKSGTVIFGLLKNSKITDIVVRSKVNLDFELFTAKIVDFFVPMARKFL